MATKILMNVCDGGECRIAVIENGILQEYFVDRPSQLTHVGDVYRAVVSNVETAIQAAFVDFGAKKNAFLHVSDVISGYSPSTRLTDIYGSHTVEVIPVEEIDFSTLPERENVLDDEDLEDEDGPSRREEAHGEESGQFEDDDINAPGIMPKAEFMQSRDEAAILRTVDLERHAVDSGETNGDSAMAGSDAWARSGDGHGLDSDQGYDPQYGDQGGEQQHSVDDHHSGELAPQLTPEELEEQAKEEERRRKGQRRRGQERDGQHDGPNDRNGRRPRHGREARPALTQAAAAISQRHAPVAPPTEPAQDRRDEVRPARPAPAPRPEPMGPPPVEVQAGSSARMKLAPRPKAPASEAAAPAFIAAPAGIPALPTAAPVKAEVVEARASARVKLVLPPKKAAIAAPTEAAHEPAPAAHPESEATEAASEPDAHSRHRVARRAPRKKAAPATDAASTSESPESSGGTPESSSLDVMNSDVTGDSNEGNDAADGYANGTPARFFRRGPLPRLGSMLSRGQEVLVQVTRAAQGGKGPSVTTYLSLPGRYMVLMPNTSKCGVSRKIRDDKTRVELRRALRRLRIPEGMGVIIRTAAAGRPIEELQRDLNYLLKLWNGIMADMTSGTRAPSCAYRDSDPAVRTVRDYFTRDVSEIVIDDREVYDRVMAFFADLMPDYAGRVHLYEGGTPLFVREGVEPQIEHIFDKKVPLPSGGYLYVEQTEALVAIDVNSGRFTSESSAEETAYKTNMEAVPEIVRQLRLRDLGGIVVGDFIDMLESRHRRDVEERLKTELRKGRARIKVATTSPFGLIEMTRQRVRPSIRVYTYDECPCCGGFGHVMSPETQALRLLRAARLVLASEESFGVIVSAPANVLSYLHSNLRPDLTKIEQKYDKPITFEWDPALDAEELRLFFINRRGDRTTFNLPAEMNRFASQRQLTGFDDGGGRRRKRRRRTDQNGDDEGNGHDDPGIGADAGPSRSSASSDSHRDDGGSVEAMRFGGDRPGHARSGGGGRPPRGERAVRDARDAWVESDDAPGAAPAAERRGRGERRDRGGERRDRSGERRDGRGPHGGRFDRRGGERRGDPTHPKSRPEQPPVGAPEHGVAAEGFVPQAEFAGAVDETTGLPMAGAVAHGGPQQGGQQGPMADGARRRRGRRGGRRHRRNRDGSLQGGPNDQQSGGHDGQGGGHDGQQTGGFAPDGSYDPSAPSYDSAPAEAAGGWQDHGQHEYSSDYASPNGGGHEQQHGGHEGAEHHGGAREAERSGGGEQRGRRPATKKLTKKLPVKKAAVKKAPAKKTVTKKVALKKAPAKKAVKKKTGA
jgi:ribonuclease E